MMLKANLREAARSLTAARQRSILALPGIGIGSVIKLRGLSGWPFMGTSGPRCSLDLCKLFTQNIV